MASTIFDDHTVTTVTRAGAVWLSRDSNILDGNGNSVSQLPTRGWSFNGATWTANTVGFNDPDAVDPHAPTEMQAGQYAQLQSAVQVIAYDGQPHYVDLSVSEQRLGFQVDMAALPAGASLEDVFVEVSYTGGLPQLYLNEAGGGYRSTSWFDADRLGGLRGDTAEFTLVSDNGSVARWKLRTLVPIPLIGGNHASNDYQYFSIDPLRGTGPVSKVFYVAPQAYPRWDHETEDYAQPVATAISSVRVWRVIQPAVVLERGDLIIDLKSFEERTGLVSHPVTVNDTDSGWQVYAAMGDFYNDGDQPIHVQNACIVIAKPPSTFSSSGPDTFNQDVIIDVAMNTEVLQGFLAIPIGGMLGEDNWGMGKDQNIGMPSSRLPDGTYGTITAYSSSYGAILARNYYLDDAHVEDYWKNPPPAYRDGSKALGHFTGKHSIGDYLVDTYFLLAVQIRVKVAPGTADDYPNSSDYEVVARGVFYLGTPLKLNLTTKPYGQTYKFA